MKMLVTVAVLATVIAAPALAQTAQQRQSPQQRAQVRQPAIQTQAIGQRHSSNPANDVYDNGRYVGSDPDVSVRSQLLIDRGGDSD